MDTGWGKFKSYRFVRVWRNVAEGEILVISIYVEVLGTMIEERGGVMANRNGIRRNKFKGVSGERHVKRKGM